MPVRREFLTRLPAGFALAAQPIAAQSLILTDSKSLNAGPIEIPTPRGSQMPAYRAMPSRGDNHPFVLVIEEIFGIHAYIQDICRRLAKLGYCAIAPDLFFREGDVTKLQSIEDIIAKVVSKVSDAQALADLDTTLDWAAQHSGIHKDRVAVTGFCWGGRMTWLWAAHQPRVKAGAAWYGVLARPASERQPRHPADIAEQLRVPVLGLYGGQDRGIPLDTVERMQAALKRGASRSEIEIYPDAPHGFHADYRDSYRKAAADDGWARMLAWFRRHGVA